jgi:hypothetical protein
MLFLSNSCALISDHFLLPHQQFDGGLWPELKCSWDAEWTPTISISNARSKTSNTEAALNSSRRPFKMQITILLLHKWTKKTRDIGVPSGVTFQLFQDLPITNSGCSDASLQLFYCCIYFLILGRESSRLHGNRFVSIFRFCPCAISKEYLIRRSNQDDWDECITCYFEAQQAFD